MADSNIKTCGGETKSLSLAGKRYHFIGAGGVGMSGLAKLLIKNDVIVSGSDQSGGTFVDNLRKLGADIQIGHDAVNLSSETDAVVISAAISEDNPELAAARLSGCEVYKYAQMLGLLMNRYEESIAVAGTHGKSTTAGWLVHCLRQGGVDPSFVVGAQISQLGCSSGAGGSECFVAEACEYDRSFLKLKPKVGCLLNIEADHLDYYKDEDDIVDAFAQFAENVRSDGVIIANGEDSNVRKVLERPGSGVSYETFGFGEGCNYSARNIVLRDGLYDFEVCYNGKSLGETRISLPGRHNILNALAVTAMAIGAGVEPGRVLELLPLFTGIERRLMFKGQVDGVVVLDDYAHHPTEIRASLEAIRQRYEPKRIFCVFQPHQYSRTRFLLDDFAESFKLADVTIVPEIYFVRDTEASKKKVNSRMLVERIGSNGTKALFIDGFEEIGDYLQKNVAAGDLLVTMGAGDIWKVSDGYIQWLRENC